MTLLMHQHPDLVHHLQHSPLPLKAAGYCRWQNVAGHHRLEADQPLPPALLLPLLLHGQVAHFLDQPLHCQLLSQQCYQPSGCSGCAGRGAQRPGHQGAAEPSSWWKPGGHHQSRMVLCWTCLQAPWGVCPGCQVLWRHQKGTHCSAGRWTARREAQGLGGCSLMKS
jgi:hypothetical protein